MGYVTLVPNTTITSSWGNGEVRDQVISKFANIAARDSAVTSPVEGMYADVGDTDTLWRRSSAGWRIFSRGLLGGTRWVGGGNLVTGLTTTELVVMTAASTTTPPLTAIEVSVGMRLLSSAANDVYVFRIRENNAGGGQIGELTWAAPNATSGFNQFFKGYSDNTAGTSRTSQWLVTAQRVFGTGSLTMVAGPVVHNTHISVSIVGHSGALTDSATP